MLLMKCWIWKKETAQYEFSYFQNCQQVPKLFMTDSLNIMFDDFCL